MKPNVCGIDRALRVIIGLVLIGTTLAGMIGIVRYCPAYAILGLETCPVAKD